MALRTVLCNGCELNYVTVDAKIADDHILCDECVDELNREEE